ncbi:MAG: DUF6982 domain-containing protein [Janthinobacterium lividum]
MSTSLKKVVLRRFSPGPLWGYLPAGDLLPAGSADALGLLDLSGRVQSIPLADVKYVCYVRDFNTSDNANPERLSRKTFLGRPRTEGLWLRLGLRDGDLLEGLAALDSSFADGWAEDRGVYLIPPDIRGNTQRLYVPRAAIASMEMVAVVTTPSRKRTLNKAQVEEAQPDLFSLQLPPGALTN